MKRRSKKKAKKAIGAIGAYFLFEFISFMFLATRHPEILKDPQKLFE